MRNLLILQLTLLATLTFGHDDPQRKTLLAIFAHPDDESAIGPLLVKYGKTHRVYLIVATDGRLGTRPGFPKGDSLAVLRQSESQCACKLMGIEPPVFLGFPDGFDTRIGVGIYFKQSSSMKVELTNKIKEINPDMIITFGPDGDTGHSDHRMIGNMTTEIILKEGWVQKYPLYYLGWTEKDDTKFKIIGGLNTVDPKYLNVTIKYSQQEEDIAMDALTCYKSQQTSQDIKEWRATELKDVTNAFFFRQLTVPTSKRSEF